MRPVVSHIDQLPVCYHDSSSSEPHKDKRCSNFRYVFPPRCTNTVFIAYARRPSRVGSRNPPVYLSKRVSSQSCKVLWPSIFIGSITCPKDLMTRMRDEPIAHNLHPDAIHTSRCSRPIGQCVDESGQSQSGRHYLP